MATVCFTGHRPKGLFGYSESARAQYKTLAREVAKVCERMMEENGVDRFISGGAQGADQTCFWAVENLRRKGCSLSNIVYMPFMGQQLPWPVHTMFGQKEYLRMLEEADEVYDCARASRSVYEKLTDRNHDMVDNSDFVVCIWNESAAPGSIAGGTSECVRYAQKTGRPVFVLDIAKGYEFYQL